MEVDEAERASYLSSLRSAYGDEILPNDVGLQATYQRCCEALRHRTNSRVWPEVGEVDREPRRLLVSVTQRCTFVCRHCWVFGSPAADCVLSLDELDAIHQHTSARHSPRWTVSGGEFFTLSHFAETLQRYPVDCVFTNGFWGYPKDRCRQYVARIASALRDNRHLRDNVLTLILSYDTYHVDASGKDLPLATAIANIVTELYKALPGVQLRISHTRSSPEDTGYREVVSALEEQGFSVSQTARLDHNGNIVTKSYRYQQQRELAKELFVDTYPMTLVCRALLYNHAIDPSSRAAYDATGSSPRARYEYAVGPDGGVGLYQILYAPPVPYCLGDLVYEPWSAIAERVAKDPIAVTLDEDGIGPIVSFLNRYYPTLMRSLNPGSQLIQQFLYFVLLDPDRRLLLNTYLLRQSYELGRLAYIDPDLEGLIHNVLETTDAACRHRSLRELYGDQPSGYTL
jgi:hypothetical protein